MSLSIAVVSAGAMGAAVGARLARAGCTVLTNLDGRSDATRERARKAGMQDVPLPELAQRARIVLSILPPGDAVPFAELYIDAFKGTSASTSAAVHPAGVGEQVIFADCNAVSPQTVKRIAARFSSLPISFVDAGIVGGPPSETYNPTFYASADAADSPALDAFVGLENHGLKVSALRGEGAAVGDASALKMSYAGISKGMTGLLTTMILAAHRSSPATSRALMLELNASQNAILKRATVGIPGMLPKAYRWVGEMEEISSFVSSSLRQGNTEAESGAVDGAGEGAIHQGMASLYSRIEQSIAEDREDGDVDVLRKWVADAKEVLDGR